MQSLPEKRALFCLILHSFGKLWEDRSWMMRKMIFDLFDHNLSDSSSVVRLNCFRERNYKEYKRYESDDDGTSDKILYRTDAV